MASSIYVEHLSKRELKALTEYKYMGEDRSITYKYVMGPLYNRLVCFLPLWLAPNAVTFIGFLLAVSGHALLMYHIPYFDSQAPGWVYIYSGTALFIYMVLDNLDGKQARRTQSSSPLGHLFDHGCDAINVTLSGMSCLAAVQLGPNWMSMTLLYLLGQISVFMATLEEYITGAMILREVNGPNEGIIALCMFQIVSGLLGPAIWTTPVTIPFMGGLTTTLNHFAYYAALFPTLNAVVFNAFGIIKHHRAAGLALGQAVKLLFQQSLSIITFGLCFNGWALLSPQHFRAQLVPILWLSGSVLFDLISRMILAHLARAKYPIFPQLFYALLFCTANSIAHAQWNRALVDPTICTSLTLGITVVYNGWRIWCLIAQLCDYLNVRCFSLRKLREFDSNTDKMS